MKDDLLNLMKNTHGNQKRKRKDLERNIELGYVLTSGVFKEAAV